jgi:hypothetical protein
MQNNEFSHDAEVELQDSEAVVETTETVDSSTEEGFQEEAAPTIEDQLKRAQADAAKYKRLFQKTQKSQVVQKETTTQKAPSQINNTQTSSPNIEEVVLRAQGVDQDSLNYLKKVAAINNTSLIDAQSDELFQAFKEKREREIKSEKARLGVTRGSTKSEPKKVFSNAGIPEKDHHDMWKEKMGK